MIERAPEALEPPVVAPRAVLPIERAAAALEVFLCSGFPTQIVIITLLAAAGVGAKTADGGLSAPFVFSLTLLDTVLVVGLIAFFLRAHRESFRASLFGLRRLRGEILRGIALIPASYLVVTAALMLVQLIAPSLRNVPHNPFADLARTRADAIIFLVVAIVGGGVREEVQRGFVLRRFDQYLGGGAVGLAIFSVLFGLGHIEQGYDVALATTALGVFWGAVFLQTRSIAAPMVGHAGFNLLQVVTFVLWGK